MSEHLEESIPENRSGSSVDVEDSVRFSSTDEAQTFFQQLKERLFQVNQWHEYAGPLSADFQLTDKDGTVVERKPQNGDHFRIKVPGPGIQSGNGYDWVQVEEIRESAEGLDDCTLIRVRPTQNPTGDKSDVAHFFTDEATSNFIIKREGTMVTAGVYGRNEKPNVKAAEDLLDKVRNAVVGTGGVAAFSKLQWQALVKGLLQTDKKVSD